MSYANNQLSHKIATRSRPNRIQKRFIKAYGRRGSGNVLLMTGKQARRYARALRADERDELFMKQFSEKYLRQRAETNAEQPTT